MAEIVIESVPFLGKFLLITSKGNSLPPAPPSTNRRERILRAGRKVRPWGRKSSGFPNNDAVQGSFD